MKKNFSEYTESEFLDFMREVIHINNTAGDEELDVMLDRFISITEHPARSDLFYYPEKGVDNSAEGITETVKKWREANGLPGFKKE